MRIGIFRNLIAVVLLLGFIPFQAHAQINPVSAVLSQDQINILVKTFAIAFEHRAYAPASPLGPGSGLGLEAGLEATAVKVPTAFTDALAAMGAGSALPLPIFPAIKVAAHKGLGAIDVGASGLWYLGSFFVGGDVKWVPGGSR